MYKHKTVSRPPDPYYEKPHIWTGLYDGDQMFIFSFLIKYDVAHNMAET